MLACQKSSLGRTKRLFHCRDVEIQYGRGGGKGLAGPHVQFGDAWLEQKKRILRLGSKPFLNTVLGPHDAGHGLDRKRLTVRMSVHAYEHGNEINIEGKSYSINGVRYPLLKAYICGGCQAEMETDLARLVEEARQRKIAEAAKKRFEATWRQPQPGEFPAEKGAHNFTLLSPTLSLQNVRFQWRTSKLFCRGVAGAFVMMMTVDGGLTGRGCEVCGSTEGHQQIPVDNSEQLATKLLVRWLERVLQPELDSVRALFTWNAGDPDLSGLHGGCGPNPGPSGPSGPTEVKTQSWLTSTDSPRSRPSSKVWGTS